MESETLKDGGKSWGPAIAKSAFLVLTLILLAGVIYLLHNVLHAVILGILFGMLLMPVYNWILSYVTRVFRSRVRSERDKQLSLGELERRFRRIDSRNRNVASALTVVLVFVIVVIPLGMFSFSVIRQGYQATVSAQEWLHRDFPVKVRTLIDKYDLQSKLDKLAELYDELGSGAFLQGDAAGASSAEVKTGSVVASEGAVSDVERGNSQEETGAVAATAGTGEPKSAVSAGTSGKAQDIGPWIGRLVGNVIDVVRETLLLLLSEVGVLVFNFCIMLFVMYQVFYDGKNIFDYLKGISPLGDEEQRQVSQRVKEVSRAVVFGIFGTAAVQGLFATIFFHIAGIPMFWGVVLGICSIVPVVGTSIIWIPVVIYLALIGNYGMSLFIFLTCGCFVANFDMILRPLLMKKGGKTGMSYMVLFLSIMGGVQTFGLVGVIYGPMIAGLCSICLLIFSTQFKMRGLHHVSSEDGESLSDC